MILIAHRGNINGPNESLENTTEYITEALDRGYNVEVDVWSVDNTWYLGHDEPQYEISIDFLINDFLWCHAKNIAAFKKMLVRGVHCFWHQGDDVTLTSRGYIWTLPGKELTTESVCVLPELIKYDELNCAGICSDYIKDYSI